MIAGRLGMDGYGQRKGGRIKPVPSKRFATGGNVFAGSQHHQQVNKDCRMLTSITDCKSKTNCNWNYQQDMCV